MSVKNDNPLLARHLIDYVYVPAALLVVGTLVVKREWTPYSVALALAFGTWNFFQFRQYISFLPLMFID
jgi:cytochrome-b5 reductase